MNAAHLIGVNGCSSFICHAHCTLEPRIIIKFILFHSHKVHLVNINMYNIISQTQHMTQSFSDTDDDTRPSQTHQWETLHVPHHPDEDNTISDKCKRQLTKAERKHQSPNKTNESQSKFKGEAKVLMDVASVKAINQILSEEMKSFKKNRIVKQSHIDLTLQWSKTWEKAMKQEKKKRRKPLFVNKKKRIQCSKRIQKKRANFYRIYHNVSSTAKPISSHLHDSELNGDPNMENYVEDFDVNEYL